MNKEISLECDNKSFYKYIYSGDFWTPEFVENNYNYSLEVTLPMEFPTLESARNCKASLRFQKIDGHILLVVWSDWHQGFDKEGKWREGVKGEPVGYIRWQDWREYRIARSRTTDIPCIASDEDYIPIATPWDELFEKDIQRVESKSLEWVCTVESLSYSIIRNDTHSTEIA